MSTLHSSTFQRVVTRLWSEAQTTDEVVIPRAVDEGKRQGGWDDATVAPFLRDAYMPVDADTGRFLYQLVRARRPQVVVEFGTSFGLSALHIAAALRDVGHGRLVTSELEPHKVSAARASFAEAGLADLIEVREGDAHRTLADLQGIEVLFLDGWKAQYLPLLKALEPRLARGAVLVGDDLDVLPEAVAPYVAYVSQSTRYVTVQIPIGDRLALSTLVE
jgi:predicted O-methyltransferase YrrM